MSLGVEMQLKDHVLRGSLLRFLLYGWYLGPTVWLLLLPIYLFINPIYYLLRTMSFEETGMCNNAWYKIWVRRSWGAYTPKEDR